ncbi:MAG: alpha/beta hydrolase [Actinomycetota bacterium]|nr:alpha/beta hydrolase [Actinomycetota bacterium]
MALHGWGRSHADFSLVLGAPVREGEGSEREEGPELDAVAIDLPGFGATPPPPEPWGSEQYAHAVSPLLEQCAPKVVLLGHSFGGKVAVRLADARPDRVAAVVLSGTPLFLPEGRARRAPAGYRAVRALARAGIVGEERLERARRRHGSPDYRAASGVMRGVLVRTLQERYEGSLGRISCPVELVWGEQDEEVRVEVARRAAAVLADARVVCVPGVGHMTPRDAPRALRDALERHRP